MGFFQPQTRNLVLVMVILTGGAITIASFYYHNINRSVDPRIKPARELYEKYNDYAARNAFDSVFFLMDTIETIYRTVPHYRNSYETGVLYNNRAAAYLTMMLHEDKLTLEKRDSLARKAGQAARKSIRIYRKWTWRYGSLPDDSLEAAIREDFLDGLRDYSLKEQEKFLETRIREIREAQVETARRQSVSYTNLGIVYRYHARYDSAALCYQRAMELWDRNLTAENNLNRLLDRPLKKRNLLQKLFPPERID